MRDGCFSFETDNIQKVKRLGKSMFSSAERAFAEEIVMLPVEQIDELEDIVHPFTKSMYEGIQELASLIEAAGGIQQPLVVRPKADGRYEILIGRRRRMAAILLKMSKVPAVVRDVDDTTAKLILTDNLGQREKIYPSERAIAYQLELDALKQQGKKRSFEGTTKEFLKQHFGQNVPEVLSMEAREIVAKLHDVSSRSISYYLRLNSLIPALVDFVDAERMPLRVGAELSYLRVFEQEIVADILEGNPRRNLRVEQAQALKQKSRLQALKKEDIIAMIEPPEKKHSQPDRYRHTWKHLKRYCQTLSPQKQERLYQLKEEDFQALLIDAIDRYLGGEKQ